MKIVITGGLGFIGSHLSRALLKEKNNVYILDRNCSDEFTFCYRCNLDNPTKTLSLLTNIRPDVIVHLAGSHKPERAISSPNSYIKRNVAATLNILQYIGRSENKPKIIFSSSAGALYTSGPVPYSEHSKIEPISSYGITKMLEENLIKYYGAQYAFSYEILRFSNIYGPGQEKYKYPSIVPSIILSLFESRPVRIYGEGRQIRDFIFIDDAVGAIMKVLKAKKSNIFNVSSGKGTPINSLYTLICQKMQIDKTKFKSLVKGSVGVEKSIVSNRHIRYHIKWKPKVSLDEGLEKTISYLAKNRLRVENRSKSTY